MNYDNDYILRFNLTGFIGARVVEVEDEDDHLERGVFIPIDRNVLYEDEGSKHVMCEAFVNQLAFSAPDRRTHSVRQKTPMAHVERLKSLGFNTPNLGGMWKNERYKRKGAPKRSFNKFNKNNKEE